ncbi:MAG: FecR domain-containing protein, partial [Thiobacillaceae bacterium]
MRRFLLALALLIPTQAPAAEWLYLTYPGDTLSQIGERYLKNWRDWPKVMQLNRIPHERVLPVNTRIRIPVELMRADPAPAVVTHGTGNVRVQPADGPVRPLTVGARLTGGATVLTGPRSFATFRLADASVLKQQPLTRLVFGRLAAYGDTGMVSTEVDLQDGRLEANASRQVSPAGGFQVKTPIAVAGLRGTAFRLNMDAEGKTLRGEVLDGAVSVSAARKEVVVPAGQGTLTTSGRPPAPARPLLPAPAVIALPTRIRARPIRFSWQRDEAAHSWRA